MNGPPRPSGCSPGNPVNLWNLSGLEDGVGDAAESGPDIESEDETPRVPGVGLAGARGRLHGRLLCGVAKEEGDFTVKSG